MPTLKKNLTPAQKKVVIAKDVLKQLRVGRFIAIRGTYVDVTKAKRREIMRKVGKQFQPIVQKIKKCQVCAIGSVLMSYVDKYNECRIPTYGISDFGREFAARVVEGSFSYDELKAMEDDFEYTTVYSSPSHRSSANAALTTIMKKIVKSKGAEYESLTNAEIIKASQVKEKKV